MLARVPAFFMYFTNIKKRSCVTHNSFNFNDIYTIVLLHMSTTRKVTQV